MLVIVAVGNIGYAGPNLISSQHFGLEKMGVYDQWFELPDERIPIGRIGLPFAGNGGNYLRRYPYRLNVWEFGRIFIYGMHHGQPGLRAGNLVQGTHGIQHQPLGTVCKVGMR